MRPHVVTLMNLSSQEMRPLANAKHISADDRRFLISKQTPSTLYPGCVVLPTPPAPLGDEPPAPDREDAEARRRAAASRIRRRWSMPVGIAENFSQQVPTAKGRPAKGLPKILVPKDSLPKTRLPKRERRRGCEPTKILGRIFESRNLLTGVFWVFQVPSCI